MEKLLMTQALDERDLLAKRIKDAMLRASFIDTKVESEASTSNGVSPEIAIKNIKGTYQSIRDLINRYDRINSAIIKSNAETQICVCGKTMTVAEGISYRSRISSGRNFEFCLAEIMEEQYRDAVLNCRKANMRVEDSSRSMLTSIASGDNKDDSMEIVERFKKSRETALVDPLGLEALFSGIRDEQDATIKELDTAIKVSNATTMIEF